MFADSTLFESDLEDPSFPLFGPAFDMSDQSLPIGIAARQDSTSPRQQTSNLTSALRSTSGNELRSSQAVNVANNTSKPLTSARHDSLTMMGLTPQTSGAVPISMTSSEYHQLRRESGAGSVMTGVSWGVSL